MIKGISKKCPGSVYAMIKTSSYSFVVVSQTTHEIISQEAFRHLSAKAFLDPALWLGDLMAMPKTKPARLSCRFVSSLVRHESQLHSSVLSTLDSITCIYHKLSQQMKPIILLIKFHFKINYTYWVKRSNPE